MANPVAYSINAGHCHIVSSFSSWFLGREFHCHLTTLLSGLRMNCSNSIASTNGENPSKKVKFKKEMSEIGQGQIWGGKRIKRKSKHK